jgi:hypothetical protein
VCSGLSGISENGNIGFGFAFLGIFAVFYIESLFDLLSDQPPTSASLPLGPVLLAIALLAILALRLGVSLRSESNFQRLTLSMGAIGITFTILAVLAPRFSITTSVGSIVSIPVAGAVISVCMFGGSLDRARRASRRELHHPKRVTPDEVGVEPPTQVAVEALGAIDVRNRDDDDLELHVDPLRSWGLDCSFAAHLSTAHV